MPYEYTKPLDTPASARTLHKDNTNTSILAILKRFEILQAHAVNSHVEIRIPLGCITNCRDLNKGLATSRHTHYLTIVQSHAERSLYDMNGEGTAWMFSGRTM